MRKVRITIVLWGFKMIEKKTTINIIDEGVDRDVIKQIRYHFRNKQEQAFLNKVWVGAESLRKEYAVLKARLLCCDNDEIEQELADFEKCCGGLKK